MKTNNDLHGKKVAILLTQGFEEVEMTEPRSALEEAGAETVLIAAKSGQVRSWREVDWGTNFDVDLTIDKANAEQFDALLLPGGVLNADKLRMNSDAVRFVKSFFEAGKPVAAICHGPVMLIEAGVLKDRTVTSYPAIRSDLVNAGAKWLDEKVLVDRGLVTSRKPDDLPAFIPKMIEEFTEGIHDLQSSTGKRKEMQFSA